MLLTALVALVQLQAPVLPADSVERLRREARRAETKFERLSRQLIPIRFGYTGTQCDEVVGRFCLTYDTGRPPEPGPEHGQVIDARRDAIEALRLAYTYLPDDFATAAPLIRYLVEDDRAQEALATARLFRLASGDSVWVPLLLGFAEHAAGRDTAAERLFDEAARSMSPRERTRMYDLEWVVEAGDRRAYSRMDSAGRVAFSRRFWTLADPLYLTPGNESRAEHIARHVWSRMLERAPYVADMVRWGDDLDQLTVRYGVPVARTRAPGTRMREGGMTEHFDPDQLAYSPVDLVERGPPPTPLPGRPWQFERERSRTGFAPVTMRRLLSMPHQVTRIPSGNGTILRLDGIFVLDSAATGMTTVDAGLFVLDSDLHPVDQRRAEVDVVADSARLSFEIPLPRGDFVYSLEGVETSTRLAGRARFAVEDDSTAGLRVSDPILTFPWSPAESPPARSSPLLRPRARLIVFASDTVGLFAEAIGLAPDGSFQVQLSIEALSRGSIPARVFSWIGDKLGLSEPESPTRLSWTDQADPDGNAVLAVELFPREGRKGDQVIVLRITDSTSGEVVESRRIFRIDSVD